MNIDITMVLFLLMYALLVVLVLEVVKLEKKLNDMSQPIVYGGEVDPSKLEADVIDPDKVQWTTVGPLKEEDELEEILDDLKKENSDDSNPFRDAHDFIKELREDIEIPIHLISPEQYFFEKSYPYERFELTYYEEDDRLEFMQNNGEPFIVGNRDECISNEALKFFGFFPGNPNVVFVRNHLFSVDFKITKVNEVKEDAGV